MWAIVIIHHLRGIIVLWPPNMGNTSTSPLNDGSMPYRCVCVRAWSIYRTCWLYVVHMRGACLTITWSLIWYCHFFSYLPQLGGLVFLYHPCAPEEQVLKLKELAKSCLRRHIITPYPNLTRNEVKADRSFNQFFNSYYQFCCMNEYSLWRLCHGAAFIVCPGWSLQRHSTGSETTPSRQNRALLLAMASMMKVN